MSLGGKGIWGNNNLLVLDGVLTKIASYRI